MKIIHRINKKKYLKNNKHLNRGKYANQPIELLETSYIAHALESFILDDGLRFALIQELNNRCNLKDFL
jgi:hypothetical protein